MTSKEKNSYNSAFKHKIAAEDNLTKCVQSIAKRKGFVNWKEFDCCFASGNETVVQFNGEFAGMDLDILTMSNMTAEEIIDRFTTWYSEYSRDSLELLKQVKNDR